jgi:hypothetical protein
MGKKEIWGKLFQTLGRADPGDGDSFKKERSSELPDFILSPGGNSRSWGM